MLWRFHFINDEIEAWRRLYDLAKVTRPLGDQDWNSISLIRNLKVLEMTLLRASVEQLDVLVNALQSRV